MVLMLTLGLLIFLILGMPVAVAIGLSAVGAAFISGPATFSAAVVAIKMQASLHSFIFLAVPLFILAAKLMNNSGISHRIFGFANTSLGFLPGGLAQANVGASLLFAGMTGAAVVDAAGLGQVEIDSMTKNGYPKDLSVAVTAASSTIGPIFPPSVPMIVFSFVSSVSVGRLFLGGVVPGLLMTAGLMIMVAIVAKRRDLPRQPVPTLKLLAREFMAAFFPLLTPVILLGGIWLGFFTPTEAAAVAVVYAFIVTVFVMKELKLKEFINIFIDTAKEAAKITLIVAVSAFYGWVLMRSGLTITIAQKLVALSSNPLVVLIVINIFLLIIGCFLDSTVAILILGPVLMPVINQLGIDPVHFGVVMVLNLMLGLMTPPFGVILFVMSEVSGMKVENVIKAVLPYLIPIFIVLVLMIFIPGIVTALPNLLMN